MQEQQKQLIDRLKEAKNVLVTVSKNPTVDQLSAAIGLTVALNRLDKHATAVYSGQTPSTLQFLRPEETLEKTTDSLRDFIISLDKSKADKLRYKVEDQVVRIFITPYHTAISESDLDFSQGDFNVDVVVALGVSTQQDIDEAIVAHGRILHDAVVASLSNGEPTDLGAINWIQQDASSLSEMVFGLIDGLDNKIIDTQIATALLTGIVSETDRFRNDHTTPKTMNISASLMAAGANQQLISSELETPPPEPIQPEPVQPEPTQPEPVQPELAEADEPLKANEVTEEVPPAPPKEPGTLEIDHEKPELDFELPDVYEASDQPQIRVDENGKLFNLDQSGLFVNGEEALPELPPQDAAPKVELKRERMSEPPAFDEKLTANTEVEGYSPSTEELTQSERDTPILSHNLHVLDSAAQETAPTESVTPSGIGAPDSAAASIRTEKTLTQIEQEVNSSHLHAQDIALPSFSAPNATPPVDNIGDARNAVDTAFSNSIQPAAPAPPEPVVALNAMPLSYELHDEGGTSKESPKSDQPNFLQTQQAFATPSSFPGVMPTQADDNNQPLPPAVPPPMIPTAA